MANEPMDEALVKEEGFNHLYRCRTTIFIHQGRDFGDEKEGKLRQSSDNWTGCTNHSQASHLGKPLRSL